MIRSYFGLEKNPFSMEHIELLPHQQEVYDILQVHSQQGGLCLIMGEPGTGKTVIKDAIKQNMSKKTAVITISRTLHTYTNTIKMLCQAFNMEFEGVDFKCEKRLIEEAFNLNRQGKTIITIIDDAHLMEMNTLRKLSPNISQGTQYMNKENLSITQSWKLKRSHCYGFDENQVIDKFN